MRKYVILFAGLLLAACPVLAGEVVRFEDVGAALPTEGFYNGSDWAGGFSSGSAAFNNLYDETYGPYWEGFGYSNRTDAGTAGMDGQYTAVTGTGAGGSDTYALAAVGWYTSGPRVTMGQTAEVLGAYFTNNSYAYYSMLDGDGFAKKFEAGDWFKLTITGYVGDTPTGSLDFPLADGIDILNQWQWFDLSGLGAVSALGFGLSSSDTGAYGMNTPAYFAMDDLTIGDVVPEPASALLLAVGAATLRRRK